MDNFSVRSERNFHSLATKPKQIHLLDEPSGFASAMVKSSLSHQMRFTVQKLEKELCAAGDPHVLQIKLLGDNSREPSSWKLFADGKCVADGSGAFARECFCEGAEVFLDLCRDAVETAELCQWSEREYELLGAARGIAGGCRNRSLMTVASAGMTYRSINDLNNVADAPHFTSKALSDQEASSISLISPIDCSEKVSSCPYNRPYEKRGRDRRPYAVSKLTSRSRKEHLASMGQRYTGIAATIMEDRHHQ